MKEKVNEFQTFLYQQAPMVVLLIVILYCSFQYFIKLQEKRDAYFKEVINQLNKAIDSKDEQISAVSNKLIDIVSQNTTVIQMLTRSIDELRKDLNK